MSFQSRDVARDWAIVVRENAWSGIDSKYAAPKVVFNTSHLLTALKNAGSAPVKVRFSNKGIAGVSVETELATYDYFMRAKEM